MGHLTYMLFYFRHLDASKACILELIFQASFGILTKSPLEILQRKYYSFVQSRIL